ncbi:MAG: UDP-N-acetylglucosamine 2-epimerase (non-hydrolyzing) [Bacteroidales bacterium]|nr:UDP-N-acetylglucosamine 2-epimerase (non-hydrolyzing) [Bacteroidales bacterium]MBN2698009.1 UDP-N-acetylglucosamine 2-epimerase (non-hydrolyzing) [Bacteroidales bacterium]
MKILTIVGARPQFIKAAAITRKIQSSFDRDVNEILVHTGQHYDQYMSEVFFREMGIPEPAFNLGIGSANHGFQTGEMMRALEELMLREKPAGVIVYGDTNSTLAGALAASKLFIPVIHIEAGLRSFNKSMPEEINRIVTDHVSTMMFSPTVTGIRNLEREGLVHGDSAPYHIDHPGIFHCGDIMYDNTLFFKKQSEAFSEVFENLKADRKNYLLATIHRPSNTDSTERLGQILNALLVISKSLNTEIILPLHPRTAQKLRAFPDQSLIGSLDPLNGIHLIPPVSFLDMIRLESHARLIMTDSGGVQKEAWFLKKPVVILRAETEWVEITEHGNGILADASTEKIVQSAEYFLNNPPADFPPVYGNGDAAREILDIITTVRWG